MIQYSIYNEWSLKSFEVRVDGARETSETIASECDVTFELYRSSYVDEVGKLLLNGTYVYVMMLGKLSLKLHYVLFNIHSIP